GSLAVAGEETKLFLKQTRRVLDLMLKGRALPLEFLDLVLHGHRGTVSPGKKVPEPGKSWCRSHTGKAESSGSGPLATLITPGQPCCVVGRPTGPRRTEKNAKHKKERVRKR